MVLLVRGIPIVVQHQYKAALMMLLLYSCSGFQLSVRTLMLLNVCFLLTGAMKLDWRKAEFFGNVRVLDL